MIIIGLTGGIASGKSTVSKMIQEQHIPLIDADQIAREVVEPGEPAYDEIAETFGSDVLFADGTLNRKQLGSIIFQDESKRKKLNSIVHPQIRKQMSGKIAAYKSEGTEAIVLDIPLLFESKLTGWTDKVLLVYVTPDVQLKRLMLRDGSTEKEALARIQSQLPLEEKKQLADAVINNNGSVGDTRGQLMAALKQWGVGK
ncbi:dephospho-CoA kinase [Scopulibacillus darangshiensis]|uniref:Dephospho-CoA kinase n=1 Tax=Scopulibacillus darangshiensis TaxID=442528 RepID=A0A4R2PDC9_9BACL|nr:dephospho-CoA kinase [Scopulibacillus darangshiensis]TCP32101.1 dephospho-CoA kinase [Scopulibacillus darangshiensis]